MGEKKAVSKTKRLHEKRRHCGRVGHKKTVSENQNGNRAKTRKSSVKIGGADGRRDLPVSLRNVVVERSALHQLVIGVKHDAKLRNHFAGQIAGNVKFLFHLFLRNFPTPDFKLTG
ncbi:hypothetical protein I2H31_01305 [Hymenobacter sp. BT662]|uniref:Uncharacterized protein n=1 Tax=Hymenobacter ruricola TaxID=2791023 RepID=A0ABS0HYG2_9BACT|nr:hypothetical protein [Hymenobacter ruricola]